MPAVVENRSIVSAKVLELRENNIVLGMPGTEYKIQLTLSGDPNAVSAALGKRVRGVIEATALRMHPATGGGQFIEPMWGVPRIVAGRAIIVDAGARRVLVHSAAPMWVTAPEGQNFDAFREGELVNFYVESGARFTAVAEQPDRTN